ncbi:hypothetical protein PVIIG_00040 [Plasmodium vivax India VII]|uniref:Uncharacterized protein n=1 Tax=Plasmodium vivax India VII TaxID=1077284 RepID=A0A0J9S6W2_PLAVI|nr:hypothetical protein PVIIG_00040 [Plasmodium vivax India VII]
MKGRIPILTHNALLKVTNFCCTRERRYPFGFFEKERSITTNISGNKEVRIKHVEELKLKSLKKNKTVAKDDTNEDVYILNGKILYAQKGRKEKNDLKIKYGLKKAKYLDTTRNLFYSKLSDSLGESNSKDLPTREATFRGVEGVAAQLAAAPAGGATRGECYSPCAGVDAANEGNAATEGNAANEGNAATETTEATAFSALTEAAPTRGDTTDGALHASKKRISGGVKQPSEEERGKRKNEDPNEACGKSSHCASSPKLNDDKGSCAGDASPEGGGAGGGELHSGEPQNGEPQNGGLQTDGPQTVEPQTGGPRRGTPLKGDIFEILEEIAHEPSRREMKAFLNSLLLHKNKKCTNFLGNYISLYFCNILSEDLKDLKHFYFDGVTLCVNTFFSVLKELDEDQLSKMTNIYLKEYFLKIFKILKANNLNLHFENLKIENMRLLCIYNILGLIRKEGKRTKKENIKRFLYQYICVQNEDLAVLKNTNKMKFLSNIIKNGVTTRMHMLVTLSYDLCAYDTASSNCLTKNEFKNVHLEVILENQLENPFFSLQSPDSIDLKSSGWSLVDVNQILNGNLPYE